LRTRTEIEAEDAYFQSRQEKKTTKSKKEVPKATSNKYEKFYL